MPEKEAQREIQVIFPDSLKGGVYSNVMNVTHSKEEFVLDFLMVMPPAGSVTARVVISPGHMKRMIAALTQNVSVYENKFGVLTAAEEPPNRTIGFHPSSKQGEIEVQFDWFTLLLGWIGGIISGIIANYIFHKITTKKRKTGEYFSTDFTNGSLEFEGRVKTIISAEDVIKKFLESTKSEEQINENTLNTKQNYQEFEKALYICPNCGNKLELDGMFYVCPSCRNIK